MFIPASWEVHGAHTIDEILPGFGVAAWTVAVVVGVCSPPGERFENGAKTLGALVILAYICALLSVM